MKFSESWLREWVNPSISTQQLVAQLTMAGLEVDAVEPVAGSFSGVVVGEITEIKAHPDAEKLRICAVAGHPEGLKQVVCGAPNAQAGIKVPFATIGAVLPGDFKIKKAKLRGVESLGMLCGQTELAAGDDDTGLWVLPAEAPVGQDLRDYLLLDDNIIDVDLTPNRGDCLSLRGLAREVGVLNSTDVTAPQIDPVQAQVKDTFNVVVADKDACPSYAGRIIRGVDTAAPTPHWMVEKLRRAGVRSIDAIVDVTNYVLLELGQPMHAFDLKKLSGEICVRYAKPAEQITLLNDQEVALQGDTLVIADSTGAIAIAGVMGGASTAVSSSTKDIFLESAFFSPRVLAGKARDYGLHTDASHRYERGVDHRLQVTALERATHLIVSIAGGLPGPSSVTAHTQKQAPGTIVLRKKRLAALLGATIADDQVLDMLQRLGLSLVETHRETGAESWGFSVPSYRFDLTIEEDLVEEVARVYGYDQLPTRAPRFNVNLPALGEHSPPPSELKAQLVGRGYQEVITYSFIDPELQQAFDTGFKPVQLQNPISSEMSTMRTTLVPGLIGVLKTNLSRQKNRIKCFETGLRFRSEDGRTETLSQEPSVAGLIYGNRAEVSWAAKPAESDFFDLKGDLESLLAVCAKGKACSFKAHSDVAYMHPGRTAAVYVEDELAGYIGALHPATQKALGIPKAVYIFELSLDRVLGRELPAFKELSRFPAVSRDLAFEVGKTLSLVELEQAIKSAAGERLTHLKLFDEYRGEGVDPKRKSLAFNLTFQHSSRTLKDDEINASVASVVSRLEEGFNATLR